MNSGCNIDQQQNAESQLRILAAASSVYGCGKRLMAMQFVLTVPSALASSVLMAWQPSYKIWLTFFSVSIALVDAIWLSRAQTRLKRRGATLQQMFDCEVFKLPWTQLRNGLQVDSEDILSDSKRHFHNERLRKKLLDWYPVTVGSLPLPLARLICQRASLWWDLRLRDRVRGALSATLGVLAALVFIIALQQGDTVEQMILTVYVPLAPAVLWTLREMFAQHDAVKTDERGLAFVEALWKRATEAEVSEDELTKHSTLIQDFLYDARSRSPMVFNWVYGLLRSRQQEQMEHKAEQMVKQALSRRQEKLTE